MGTPEQRFKMVVSHIADNGKANGGPQGIAPPHPVPKFKSIGRGNTKGFHRRRIGGDGHKMFFNVCLIPGMGQKPFPGGMGIGHGLLGGEGLGCHQEQRGFRIYPFQCFCQMRTVNIRNKISAHPFSGKGGKTFCHHEGPQIRPTNANINKGIDGLSRVSPQFTRINVPGKLFHSQ